MPFYGPAALGKVDRRRCKRGRCRPFAAILGNLLGHEETSSEAANRMLSTRYHARLRGSRPNNYRHFTWLLQLLRIQIPDALANGGTSRCGAPLRRLAADR